MALWAPGAAAASDKWLQPVLDTYSQGVCGVREGQRERDAFSVPKHHHHNQEITQRINETGLVMFLRTLGFGVLRENRMGR